jgi:hypothetical protein
VASGRARVTAAIGVAAAGALLVALSPIVGVVSPDADPAFLSWPLLLVLAGLAPGVAAGFLRRNRVVLAAAVLVGPAVLAPGRLVLDSQLLVDAAMAARPELLLPHTLDPLSPSTGLYLLLAGHVATAVAGALALTGGIRGEESGAASGEVGSARKQGLLAVVLCTAVTAAVGMLMTQFESADPYLLPHAAMDSPVVVLVGSLLVAVGVAVTAGFAASSADPEVARGGLLGLATAVAGVVVPPLLAVVVLAEVTFTWGPLLSLLAALALAALALPAGRTATPDEDEAGEVGLPTLNRLLTISGGLAVSAGVLAIVGGLTKQIQMPPGFEQPSSYPARMLLPAGALLLLLGAGTLLPGLASRIRPAMTVAWAALPLASTAALDTVLTALRVDGAHAGPGPWVAGLAGVLAVSAAVVAALAGGVERDDVDLTETVVRRGVASPASVAALMAFAAFSFPVVTAPGYTPPGVFTEFDLTSWGLVTAMVAVVVASLLAPRCRPAQGAALLCGAALVVLVRVLELPLTSGRAAGSAPGLGLWFGLTCIVVLLAAAALSARRPRDDQ